MIGIWFRHDLRCYDNPAFYFALEDAKEKQQPVVAIITWSEDQWREKHHLGETPISWYAENVKALQTTLNNYQIPLIILQSPHFETVAERLASFCQSNQVVSLHFNNQVGVYEQDRDEQVEQRLLREGIRVTRYIGETLVPPGSIKTLGGAMFKVYTPFKKAFAKYWEVNQTPLLKAPGKLLKPIDSTKIVPTEHGSFASDYSFPIANQTVSRYSAGSESAEMALATFMENNIGQYEKHRDVPSIDGTSRLSPYLAVGALSAKQCFLAALSLNNGRILEGSSGIVSWCNEIIWREFYKHLMFSFPALSKGKPMQDYTDNVRWSHNEQLIEKWKEGKTGYPIVDAAMKQLMQTGWMHNRLRMIVASFFTKHLLQDWRIGEAYFMEQLIDGDFTANNGGWQWAASTGADASPYFRVFNPTLQAEKFDKDGTFIERYLPQLSSLTGKQKLMPPNNVRSLIGYESPIVEHKVARERVLKEFKIAKEAST